MSNVVDMRGQPIDLPDPRTFAYWLTHARPGDTFVYHVGNLMADRAYLVEDLDEDGRLVWQTVRVPAVDNMARAAWRAYLDGDVTLQQRRLGPNYFQYEARRRARRLDAWREAA